MPGFEIGVDGEAVEANPFAGVAEFGEKLVGVNDKCLEIAEGEKPRRLLRIVCLRVHLID
jgi:hypothetical protein